MNYLQQGDVILVPTDSIPSSATKLETKVVQEGEHTGHAHRLIEEEAFVYEEPKTKQKYLRLVKPSDLTHEEHKKIKVPVGDFEVRIVREYDHFLEETRQVLD